MRDMMIGECVCVWENMVNLLSDTQATGGRGADQRNSKCMRWYLVFVTWMHNGMVFGEFSNFTKQLSEFFCLSEFCLQATWANWWWRRYNHRLAMANALSAATITYTTSSKCTRLMPMVIHNCKRSKRYSKAKRKQNNKNCSAWMIQRISWKCRIEIRNCASEQFVFNIRKCTIKMQSSVA